MSILGMAINGLGFYSSQFVKSSLKKPKQSCLGLVKILEGVVSVLDLRTLTFTSRVVESGRLISVRLVLLCTFLLKKNSMS